MNSYAYIYFNKSLMHLRYVKLIHLIAFTLR